MNATEYKKRFDTLYHYLLEIYATFYSWKSLQDERYELFYDEAKYFWSAVLIALQNEWLLNLAKCFEDSNFAKHDIVISVQALLKHHPDSSRATQVVAILNNHQAVINGILRLRDHQLAHFNADHLSDPKKLLERFPIPFSDVEDLLAQFPELISLMNPASGIGYSLDSFRTEPENEAKYLMEKLRWFKERHKEYMDDFIAGKVSDPFFPPRNTKE